MRPLRRFPVFNHDENGELVQVRWNGDDRAAVGGAAFAGRRMDEWYEALRTWEGILRSEESQLWTEMEMGTAISESALSLFVFLFLVRFAQKKLTDVMLSRQQSLTIFVSSMVDLDILANDACAERT